MSEEKEEDHILLDRLEFDEKVIDILQILEGERNRDILAILKSVDVIVQKKITEAARDPEKKLKFEEMDNGKEGTSYAG